MNFGFDSSFSISATARTWNLDAADISNIASAFSKEEINQGRQLLDSGCAGQHQQDGKDAPRPAKSGQASRRAWRPCASFRADFQRIFASLHQVFVLRKSAVF
jgi:hypothetical protein